MKRRLMEDLIPVARARELVLEAAAGEPQAEPVALADACGRVLAADLVSGIDVPAFDPSAMDGFAVSTGSAGELPVVGEARAGPPFGGELPPGAAIRVSTGAPVPPGTVAVVPVERAEDRGETVVVEAARAGANIRRRGEDVRAGDAVLRAGTVLGPAELGLAATVGTPELQCARRPRVAIVTTGDELTRPGEPAGEGSIYSSNDVVLSAQTGGAGAELVSVTSVGDDLGATREAIAAAIGQARVVICSGGVSVGPHDHVKPALAAIGAEERFWGVALKPGKPSLLAVAPGGELCFGLPGNPVSALITFELFVRPALRVLQGAAPFGLQLAAVLGSPVSRTRGREEAVRVALAHDGARLVATPTGRQNSNLMTSVAGADGFVLVPAGEGELATGAAVVVETLG